MRLLPLLLLLSATACDSVSPGAHQGAPHVQILAGGAHYDGSRGWVRFRYDAAAAPVSARVQFNNFTADTLRLAARSDTVRVAWSRAYRHPPDPMREWYVVHLYRGGRPIDRDTLRVATRYGRP